MKRRIVFHSGPTNSGKTHASLKKLMQADRGIYCAPLRMMAWEVHSEMVANNIPCNLITGQHKLHDPHASHTSATIESVSELMGTTYDLAIIVSFLRLYPSRRTRSK
ncbi:MAG: hypothetical protein P4M11_10975 [Candidatus Pacebacteria bacterium]|nr:hypothetical protein [Candidatus Paceibacterota bacterium]